MILSFGPHSPAIDPDGTWIAPNATVVGQAVLARRASIWFGAVVRADNEPIVIGPGTNVQDLCVLHTDPGFALTIGPDCTIGHRATLHGCTIGSGTLVGIGAIVLNGARIGSHCIVGAGALVPEGVEIADGSLVIGLPARAKRELTAAEIASVLATAEKYAARALQYRDTAVIVG